MPLIELLLKNVMDIKEKDIFMRTNLIVNKNLYMMNAATEASIEIKSEYTYYCEIKQVGKKTSSSSISVLIAV